MIHEYYQGGADIYMKLSLSKRKTIQVKLITLKIIYLINTNN